MICPVCKNPVLPRSNPNLIGCSTCQVAASSAFWMALQTLLEPASNRQEMVSRYDRVFTFLETMYPEDVFPPLTDAEQGTINSTLKAVGISRDRVTADDYRHILSRVRELVEEMLRNIEC